MHYTSDYHELINDKTRLLLKFNTISSFLSTVFGLLCLYVMKITVVIPYILFGFAALNIVNTLAFKKHGNTYAMAIITSIISFLSTLIICFYTGGITSPFMFILAIIALAGYVTTRELGRIILLCALVAISAFYFVGHYNAEIGRNVVPAESQNLFSFITMLFSTYILGWIFGRDLLKAHQNLYKTKKVVEKKIREKENLLKEVHHRVKNNLQTVSSLLSMQSRNTEDAAVKGLFKSSQNRVISMAMVHEMLYMREDISKIQYKTYVQDLVEYLVRSIKGTSENVTMNIDMPDIKLNIDTAIPLGLLINEVITNALKYGIPVDQKGAIDIAMSPTSSGYELRIGDHGPGYGDDITYKNSKSLGLKLIHNLARQLLGSVTRNNSKKGTHYVINFKEIMEKIPQVA